MKFPAVLLLAALALNARAAPQAYWLCADAQGKTVAQDHPCSDEASQAPRGAPEAVPLPGHNARPAAPTALEPSPNLRERAHSSATPAVTPTQFVEGHQRELIAVAVLAAFVMLLLVGGHLLLRGLAARVRSRADERRVAPARIDASPELLRAWKLSPGRQDPLLPPTPSARSAQRTAPLPMIPMPEPEPAPKLSLAPAAVPEPEPPPPPPPPRMPSLTLERLRLLERPQLEALCAGYWRIKGYAASQVGDDIHLHHPSDPTKLFAIVQCRAGAAPVGAAAVRELWGAAHHLQVKLALLYGTPGFSDDAQSFSLGKHLKLFTGEDLLNQIRGLTDEQRQQLPDPMAPA